MPSGPLHILSDLIRQGKPISDDQLIETLGREATIVVPMHNGGERRLPSGEILAVLAESAGQDVSQVLARNFKMDTEEISAAEAFIRLVQFAGDTVPPGDEEALEQPFQPLDH